MLNSLFGCERSTRPLRSVALSSPKVSILPAFFAFSTFVMSLLLVSSVTGQTTIWMENFEDETTSSATSSFAGNNWSATSTGSGTMSILNGPYGLGFEFDNTPNDYAHVHLDQRSHRHYGLYCIFRCERKLGHLCRVGIWWEP